LWNSVQTI